MSVKKYRICLLMMILLILTVGVCIFAYYNEQKKSYQEGTLVYKEYFVEEEAA